MKKVGKSVKKEGSEYFILENKMRNGYTLLESEE